MKFNIECLTLFALVIGFGLNLVFVQMFYHMLIVCGEPEAYIVVNNYGEYWFEFFGLQVSLVVIAIAFIAEAVRYWKHP